MTTERQRAANRANARKSTGPKTEAGNKRSAGNAQRHGLTGVLPQEQVLAWYRLILDDAQAEPDPFEADPERRAAYSLAEAEAHLARVRQAEQALLFEHSYPEPLNVDATPYPAGMTMDRETVGLMASVEAQLSQGRTRQLRTLARYRAEAEAQRSKALRAFVQARLAKSRNEANLASGSWT